MSALRFVQRATLAIATAALLAAPSVTMAAAQIAIINFDGAGEGFNDPTPVAPVGGNAGTTLGQQRLNAFAYAASIWEATLTSSQVIFVGARFDPLACTANSAVLGSAGATHVVRDFPGALRPATWYSAALADKLSGIDQNAALVDISARFNSNLGQANCLAGSPFYLGLDNNHGTAIDLVAVLLHEFAHGLGFQNFTDGENGNFLAGFPSVFDHFMFDNTAAKLWIDMTPAERAASAINPRKVVWTGATVTGAVPSVLIQGTPQLVVNSQVGASGTYDVGAASFGPALNAGGVSGDIMPVVDQANGTGLACTPLNPINALAVNGNIALIDRGTCTFPEKVKNAQNAGAKAVIIADNVAGAPPPGLGGADPTITIPAVRITLGDANVIKAALAFRSRIRSGVIGTINLDLSRRAGADALGRVLMFTPNPFQPGSSVSHFDTSALKNLLMEPSINADLLHSVVPPADLTYPLFVDIGW